MGTMTLFEGFAPNTRELLRNGTGAGASNAVPLFSSGRGEMSCKNFDHSEKLQWWYPGIRKRKTETVYEPGKWVRNCLEGNVVWNTLYTKGIDIVRLLKQTLSAWIAQCFDHIVRSKIGCIPGLHKYILFWRWKSLRFWPHAECTSVWIQILSSRMGTN